MTTLVTRLAPSVSGAVFAEFLISFMPFFILFVSVVQLATIATARQVVQHAALQAARAAVVTIDDAPAFYEDGKRKHLETKGSGKSRDSTKKALDMIAKGIGHRPTGLGARGTERLNRIRNAAYLPLSVISPTAEQVARFIPAASLISPSLENRSIADDLGDLPALRMVVGFGVYARMAAAITFPVSPGADKLRDFNDAEFKDREQVTVRVTYLMPCNIPLARELLCDSMVELTGLPDLITGINAVNAAHSVDDWERAFRHLLRVPGVVARFSRGMNELVRAEWAALQLPLWPQLSERFVIVTGEASLPNHGAPYKYHSELKSQKGTP
ncbi:MAG: TadE/TadG family type IV pilus assembly protein [Myxococcales bacterium]